MSLWDRVVRLRLNPIFATTDSAQKELLVIGNRLEVPFDAFYSAVPADVTKVSVSWSHGLDVTLPDSNSTSEENVIDYNQGVVVHVASRTPSETIGDRKVAFRFLDSSLTELATAQIAVTVIGLSIHADFTRDGKVNYGSDIDKLTWKWGSNENGGIGAIILVNNDADGRRKKTDVDDDKINGPLDFQDMSKIGVKMSGPKDLPHDYRILLHTNDDTSQKIRVFEFSRRGRTSSEVIGPARSSKDITRMWKGNEKVELVVEGLDYPDIGFDGSGYIHLSVIEDYMTIYQDSFVFRMAPWIMTPNTLKPKKVFVAEMKSGDNSKFINELKQLVKAAGVPLEVVGPKLNKRDRWMQDEIELGYSSAPHKTFSVVLDSPRDRGLKKYPKSQLLGPDFGYVTRGGGKANSLDSFGNLEVSPPVEGYPLGRIIFGGPTDYYPERRMMKEVRDFLLAQRVQAPIQIFSDWLSVGHVDEFMSFVPADKSKYPKGFKMLLASPAACYKLLEELIRDGHGDKKMFQGHRRWTSEDATTTANELVEDERLRRENKTIQGHIDWNRDVLKRELKLDESDIIDLPALFTMEEGGAGAYFPDMVNLLVLDTHLGIPKPFGPKVRGKCAFETHVNSLLNPLGLTCHYIDDWDSYHVLSGEVHCGTNTLRTPFEHKWWEIQPAARVE